MSPPRSSPVGEDTVTIVLADDHHVVRSGLGLLLEAQDGFAVVAEAADTDAVLRAVVDHRPKVLVLDLNMPGDVTSMATIATVRERSHGTAVVVLTMQEDPAFVRAAMKAGAAAYVVKDSVGDELVEAVRRAAAGITYLGPHLAAALDVAPEPRAEPTGRLTPREREVLRLIALGYTNAEIGVLLDVSVRTVESHRAHIQQKLRRSSRAELVRYALDHGLVSTRPRAHTAASARRVQRDRATG
jgi:two-component system, NarL family, response regulator NreC